MFAEPTNQRMDSLVSAAIVIILVGVCLASVAFAGLTVNTIDPVAIVTDDGRHLIVTGPVVCTAGETASLRVTVTQRLTGAVAQGLTRLTCTGDDQQWEIHEVTYGKETFEEGPATAVALGRTTLTGNTTGAHQWLVEITLEEE